MKNIQNRCGQPAEKLSSGKMEVMLQRGYDRLKQALSAMPDAVPTEDQRLMWLERLKKQRIAYLQREAQQFIVNNKVYDQALLDTPVDVKVLNDNLDVLFAEGYPYKSANEATVNQNSDEPNSPIIEYTQNPLENQLLNNIAAELMKSRRNSIVEHGRRQSERRKEAMAEKNEEPKSRRDKRR